MRLTQEGFIDFNISIVSEILPDGFEYMYDSYTGAEPPTYHTNNNTLVMVLGGADEITETYTVYTGTFGQIVNARFTGTYQSWDGGMNGSVTGDDTLTVAATYAESVVRELPDEPVVAEEPVIVILTQGGSFYDPSIVSEILPDGFEYVCGSFTGEQYSIYYTSNNTLVMVLGGDETTVEYTVSAGTFEQIDNAVFTGTYRGFGEGPGDADAVTGADTLTPAEQPTPPPPSHDLNGDGVITSADALIALQMACGNCAPDENADVSGDGKVTSLDALMLLQVASE